MIRLRAMPPAVLVSSIWRWAGIVLAVIIAAWRPDLPLLPVVLLAVYFLVTTFLLVVLRLSVAPQLLALVDIVVLSVAVLASGGDRSPIYIVYVLTMLEVGTRVPLWQAGVLAVAAAVGYTLSAWGASQPPVYPFDVARAATREFLFVAVALTSSSLSQTAYLARARAAEADTLNSMMRLAVGAGLEMPSVLAAIAQQICHGLRADCSLICLNGDNGEVSDVASSGMEASSSELLREAVSDDALCREALASGAVVSEAHIHVGEPGLSTVCGEVTVAACAPLALELQAIGCLWIARHDGPVFTTTETKLLALMGQQAALAVHNARLHALEKRAVAELQAAELAKTEFLATVSHELRTPLTAIRASSGLLLDADSETLSPTQLRLIKSIARNTDRLSVMVTDLLDMARLQSGRLPLRCELVDLRPIVRASLSAMRPVMEQKEQSIEAKLVHDLPRVMADRRRVEQILVNLLANAHRYTPSGGHVLVTASKDQDFVLVTVADDGPGVPAEERDLIFQRFYRGTVARRGEPAGAGLGLAVAKSLVGLHGGEIGYKDAPGGGSQFYFRLPLRGPEENNE
jgi:signal transduction histidine kinase